MIMSLPVVLASLNASVCLRKRQEIVLLRIRPAGHQPCHEARSIHAHIDSQDEVRHPWLQLHSQAAPQWRTRKQGSFWLRCRGSATKHAVHSPHAQAHALNELR